MQEPSLPAKIELLMSQKHLVIKEALIYLPD